MLEDDPGLFGYSNNKSKSLQKTPFLVSGIKLGMWNIYFCHVNSFYGKVKQDISRYLDQFEFNINGLNYSKYSVPVTLGTAKGHRRDMIVPQKS